MEITIMHTALHFIRNIWMGGRVYALPTIASVIIYGSYVQFSPKMGNVWIRNGSFRPINLLRMMVSPLKRHYMWMPSFMDLNWFFHLSACLALVKLYGDPAVMLMYELEPSKNISSI